MVNLIVKTPYSMYEDQLISWTDIAGADLHCVLMAPDYVPDIVNDMNFSDIYPYEQDAFDYVSQGYKSPDEITPVGVQVTGVQLVETPNSAEPNAPLGFKIIIDDPITFVEAQYDTYYACIVRSDSNQNVIAILKMVDSEGDATFSHTSNGDLVIHFNGEPLLVQTMNTTCI